MIIRKFLSGFAMLTLILSTASLHAWTTEIDKLKDVNTICSFEPEAQCSWAVRIGADGRGVDMHDASMASMRLDRADFRGADLRHVNLLDADLSGANLRGARIQHVILTKARLDNAIWTDGRVCAVGSIVECR